MKQIAAFALVFCLNVPALAQETPPESDGLLSFMERMLRDFMTEAEPQLRLLERGLTELEPDLQRLLDRMRDMTQYHPPEVLPNGDILIRRRQADPSDTVPSDPEQDDGAEQEDRADGAEPFEL